MGSSIGMRNNDAQVDNQYNIKWINLKLLDYTYIFARTKKIKNPQELNKKRSTEILLTTHTGPTL